MASPSMASQIAELERKLKQYSNKEVPRAGRSAINKITAKARTEIVRTVSQELKIPTKVLKTQVFATRAKGAGMRAYIKSYLRPILAARLLSNAVIQKHMGKGTNKRGVKVAGAQFDGAFINRGSRDGRAYVLQRKGAARYPLTKISVKIDASMLANQLPIAKRFTQEQFQKELIRELQYRIGKYAR